MKKLAHSRAALGGLCAAAVAAGALTMSAADVQAQTSATAAAFTPWKPAHEPLPGTSYTTEQALTGSARTLVYDTKGHWLATFTNGARTVSLLGPSRTFKETTTSASVTHKAWVRLLPAPFTGTVDGAWLRKELADRSPDALAVAFQYTTGAPVVKDADGVKIAGDAIYGPETTGNPKDRAEGNDWNDYLGITATYSDGEVRKATPAKLNAIDCSGFVRMVFGRRLGYPMTLTKPQPGQIPRRAVQILESGPGTVVLPDQKKQITSFAQLQPGDLVFFDTSQDASNDGDKVDHVGIYLGKDNEGHERFVSSRKTVNGPTMGDVGGYSRLDGTYMYAKQFRAARRL